MNKSYTLANWDGGLSAFANNSQEPTAGPLVLTHFKDSQLHSYPNASGTAKPISSPHNDTTANGHLDETETTVQSGKLSVNGHQEFPEASFTLTESSEVAQAAAKPNISAAPTIQDVALDASNLLQTPNLAFVPIANSPLHQKFTPRTRKPPSTDTNTRSTPVQTLQPLGENSRSSPRDPDVMSEALSLFTADAEGEDENEDVIVVDHLQSFSPSRAEHSEQNTAQSSQSGRDSLFTPPPSEEMIPVERLFTPEPPRRRASNHERPRVIPRTLSPPPPRLIMSHIEVPPLRRPKSDYVRLSSLMENRVHPIAPVTKPNRPAHGPTSLRDALQAAWQNNLELGAEPVPEQYAIWKKKKKKKERREEHINATAGPSKLVTSSVGSSINTQPKVFKYKRPRKERDQFDGSEKTAKRRRITIDLTLSDDDRAQTPKSKPLLPKQPKPPPPAPPPHVQTKPTQSTPCLTSDVITPIPSQVLVFNTRFIWKKCGKENVDSPSPGIAPWSLSSSRKRACICSVDDHSLSLFDEEEVEMSTGGTVGTVWDEDFRQPAEDDYDSDDSSVVVLESLPREPAQPVPPPPPPHPKPPKKIDLAERIRKKKGKEKQVSKNPSPLSKKQRQLHSQLQPTSSAGPSAFSTVSSYQASTIYVQRQGITPSTSNNSISIQEDPSTATSFPSAKSLGKRKAVSPPPLSTPFIYPLGPNSSSLPAPSRYNANLDVFMYPYDGPPCSPQSASYSHLGAFADCTRSGSATCEEQVDSVLKPHSISPSSPDVYQGSRAIVQKTLTETPPILHDFHRAQTEPEYPWASLSDHDAAALGYGFDTIDPTLLGGEPVVEIESQSQVQRSWAYASSSHISVSPSSSSSASSSSSSSFASLSPRARSFKDLQEEDGVSTATTTPDGPEVDIEADRATNAGVDARCTTETAEGRPRRNAKPRRMIDMVSIDQVDVLADPTTSEYRSSSPSDEESSDEEPSMVIVPRRYPAPMAVQKSIQVNRTAVEVKRGVPTKNKRGLEKNWPTTKTDSYCHQCRNKTFLVKMSCSGCTKQYCVRCLAMRYPDEEFDPSQVTPGCPACEGYCNCTICCQKRGVQYISSRKQAKNTSPDDVVPANQPMRRTTLGGKTNLPPPVVLQQLQPQPPPLPSNAVYWGTVYDLSGKRIGRSYFDPKAATSHVHIEKPADSVPFDPRTSATTAKRVFIGKIQRLWGLGRHPKVCELNPPARAKRLPVKREPRQYIGDKKFLSYRFDAEASSLSSVEEDESDGAGGAEEQTKVKETFSPNGLGDEDITYVIGLALMACGFRVNS